ncbi:hypothetical protein BH11PSE4_BH11PSE4_08770 [soil metagenome]
MSPDLSFALILLLRMAVTAAFVVSASVIAERAGPVIGALVATLPISAGPSYVFLAQDHDAAFIAQGTLGSIPANAATMFFCLTYVRLAQHRSVTLSLGGAMLVWLAIVAMVRMFDWSLTAGIAANAVAFAICLPLMARYRYAKMPLVTRRWYDFPLRAALVATLVATVVTLSHTIGPVGSGMLALYPVALTSMILLMHPRIGGIPTAAVIANSGWGLMGFVLSIVVLHLTAVRLGSAPALCLALAICVVWNLGLWSLGRRRVARQALS